MVEEAWLDEGDVIIAGVSFDYFKWLIRYKEYMEKHFPDTDKLVKDNLKLKEHGEINGEKRENKM